LIPVRSGARRIFIVDDEPLIASTLSLILCNSGFEAIAFTNPLDALRAALLDPPEILLTDVLMPPMSGIELAIQVRERFPQCRVLLLSGQTETGDLLAAANELGHHFDILPKPVHPSEIIGWIGGGVDEAGA
jgi:DNA-binding response OmpR family regulator